MVDKIVNINFVRNHWVFIVMIVALVLVFAGLSGGLSNLFSYEFEFPVASSDNGILFDSDLVFDTAPRVSNIKVPDHLFDISFRLEDSFIENISLLNSVVTFENFGRVPTAVDLFFSVLDEGGKNVYSANFSLEIAVEEVLLWDYEGLDSLPSGEYVAVLETVYDVSIRDEFRQNFEVGSGSGFFDRFFG